MLGAACYWGSQDPARVPGMAELLRPHSDSPSPPATSSGLRKEGTVPQEKLWDQKGGQKPQRGQQGNESGTAPSLPPLHLSPTSPPSPPGLCPQPLPSMSACSALGAAELLITTPLRGPRPLPHAQGKGTSWATTLPAVTQPSSGASWLSAHLSLLPPCSSSFCSGILHQMVGPVRGPSSVKLYIFIDKTCLSFLGLRFLHRQPEGMECGALIPPSP